MDEIKALMNLDFPTVILGVFIIILGLDKIIFLFGKIKKTLKIKFGFEEDKETLDKRIATLEKHDNWQYKEITKISQGIDDIKKRLDLTEEENNQRIIVQMMLGHEDISTTEIYMHNDKSKLRTEILEHHPRNILYEERKNDIDE